MHESLPLPAVYLSDITPTCGNVSSATAVGSSVAKWLTFNFSTASASFATLPVIVCACRSWRASPYLTEAHRQQRGTRSPLSMRMNIRRQRRPQSQRPKAMECLRFGWLFVPCRTCSRSIVTGWPSIRIFSNSKRE